MIRRALCSTVLLLLALLAACASRPVHILHAPPPAAYHTLGMVSGQGENTSAALHAVAQEAERLEADAVIVVGERPVGQVIIITGRAIRYIEAPPELR